MQDDDPRGNTSVALLKEVVAHMRANGVRRVWMCRGQLELEVELDPAAQLLGEGAGSASEGDTEAQQAEKRGKGLCIAHGCDKPGGHMGQPYCRPHFQAELNGAQTT